MKRMKRNEKWRGVFKHLAIFKLSAVVTNNLHERIGLAFVDVHTNCLAFVKHGCVTLIMQLTAFLDDCAVDGDSVLLEVCMVHLDHDEVLVV